MAVLYNMAMVHDCHLTVKCSIQDKASVQRFAYIEEPYDDSLSAQTEGRVL